jgi:hypothetical protein
MHAVSIAATALLQSSFEMAEAMKSAVPMFYMNFAHQQSRPNMRLSGRAVNKVPGLSPDAMRTMMRCRAAQLWR